MTAILLAHTGHVTANRGAEAFAGVALLLVGAATALVAHPPCAEHLVAILRRRIDRLAGAVKDRPRIAASSAT